MPLSVATARQKKSPGDVFIHRRLPHRRQCLGEWSGLKNGKYLLKKFVILIPFRSFLMVIEFGLRFRSAIRQIKSFGEGERRSNESQHIYMAEWLTVQRGTTGKRFIILSYDGTSSIAPTDITRAVVTIRRMFAFSMIC